MKVRPRAGDVAQLVGRAHEKRTSSKTGSKFRDLELPVSRVRDQTRGSRRNQDTPTGDTHAHTVDHNTFAAHFCCRAAVL